MSKPSEAFKAARELLVGATEFRSKNFFSNQSGIGLRDARIDPRF
jgi:hypothetical protein